MLQVYHPGQSCTKGDKAASVQFRCVGVFLSLSTDRPRQGKGPTLAFYRERVNLMSVFLFAARGKVPLFFPDLMSITGQKEMPLPFPSILALSPAGVAEVNRVACAQVDFPDAARSLSFVFSHCCALAVRPPLHRWLPGAPRSSRGSGAKKLSGHPV